MAILRERIPVPTSITTKRSAELKRKLAMLNATLVLAGLCSAGLVAQSVSSGPAQTHSQAAQVAGLKDSGKKISSLPVAAQRTISGTLGGDDERYRVIAHVTHCGPAATRSALADYLVRRDHLAITAALNALAEELADEHAGFGREAARRTLSASEW